MYCNFKFCYVFCRAPGPSPGRPKRPFNSNRAEQTLKLVFIFYPWVGLGHRIKLKSSANPIRNFNTRAMISNTDWERVGVNYDVFCLHTIWSRQQVEQTLGPGATYITIMRNGDLTSIVYHFILLFVSKKGFASPLTSSYERII